jgi:outer membrane lipoprotein-sorting protein
MRTAKLFLILLVLPVVAFGGEIKSGGELVAAMHKKYNGKWYKTLTFVQKTTTYKPDGTTDVATWYEAMTVPGKLRIDFDPVEKGKGMIFADGKIYSFRDGKSAGGRDLVHPLMVLGFDVYGQPVDKTIEHLRSLGIDLSIIHQTKWQGREAYVVGAKQGEMNAPQFWIDKKNLYFVRLIQLTGKEKKNVSETQFNKYEKIGGGWVSPEVVFLTDGKRTMLEEYSDMQVNVQLDNELWNPEKWMSVDKTYFKLARKL